MNRALKMILTAVVGTALLANLAACTPTKEAGQTTPPPKYANTLAKVKGEGKLVMGTSADYKPYEFVENVNGKDTIVGWEVEMAQEIAKELGVTLEIKNLPFESLLGLLPLKQADMVVAAVTIDAERQAAVDFSTPYHDGNQMLLVLKENTTVKGAADLKGKKVSAQLGSTGEELAGKIEGAEARSTESFEAAVLDLLAKKTDAVIGDKTVVENYAKINNKLQVVGEPLNDAQNAIALRKGDTELKAAIDQALDKMTRDGRLQAIKKKWLGNEGY